MLTSTVDRHPQILKWSDAVGRTHHMWDGSMKGYLHPILFEPGTDWGYGPGIDWAGRAVRLPPRPPLLSH